MCSHSRSFDVGGIEVATTDDDHVLDASHHVQFARDDEPEVTGAQHGITATDDRPEQRVGRGAIVPIARTHMLTGDPYLPDDAVGEADAPVRVDDADHAAPHRCSGPHHFGPGRIRTVTSML